MKILDGGCQIPLGVSATTEGDLIEIKCIIGLLNGEEVIIDKVEGSMDDNLAAMLYKKVECKNAKELLQRALLTIDSMAEIN